MWRHVAEARQLVASEVGAIRKDWGGKIPIVLAYPNHYAVGMSSLAVHGLYAWLNALPGVVCERAFAALDRPFSLNEPLLTLESQRPVRDAALLAFSVSFELDYFNVIAMLRRADIPVRAAEREEGDPFVILGGPAISANPEPLAAVADAIVIGEAESLLGQLVECIGGSWAHERQETLACLARLPGVYVPLLPPAEPIQRQWVRRLDDYPLATTIIAPKAEFGDMYLIEISRGCGHGCRFCLAGYWYRPPRERSLDLVLSQAREGLKHRQKIGLVAAAVSDYSAIDELATTLREMGAEISVSSLRIAPLSSMLIEALAASSSRSITFAPEAGSERLRRRINKCITYPDIITATQVAARYRFELLKLYFMWGLPGEADEDITALIDLAREVQHLFPRHVVVNLTPFVPKAHTPFQRVAMAPETELNARLARIQAELRQAKIEVRAEAIDSSRIQGVLARGDRRVGEALITMRRPVPGQWTRAMRDHGLAWNEYLGDRSADAALPWDMVDGRMAPAYLAAEAGRSVREAQAPECDPAECRRCGVCGGSPEERI